MAKSGFFVPSWDQSDPQMVKELGSEIYWEDSADKGAKFYPQDLLSYSENCHGRSVGRANWREWKKAFFATEGYSWIEIHYSGGSEIAVCPDRMSKEELEVIDGLEEYCVISDDSLINEQRDEEDEEWEAHGASNFEDALERLLLRDERLMRHLYDAGVSRAGCDHSIEESCGLLFEVDKSAKAVVDMIKELVMFKEEDGNE